MIYDLLTNTLANNATSQENEVGSACTSNSCDINVLSELFNAVANRDKETTVSRLNYFHLSQICAIFDRNRESMITYKWYILLRNRNRTTIHHHANLLSEGMNKFDGSGHNDDVSNRTGLLLISSKYIRISRTPSTPIETLLFRDSLGPWFQDSQMQGYPRHFIWALFLHTGKVVFMH